MFVIHVDSLVKLHYKTGVARILLRAEKNELLWEGFYKYLFYYLFYFTKLAYTV
jgi:hypothetical protein